MAQQTMYPAKINSPTTTLRAGITAAATTIPVADVGVFPAAPNLATIGDDSSAETILYTGINAGTNDLTGVTRGFQGTAAAWNSGTVVARYFTAYDHDAFVGNIQDLVTKVGGFYFRDNSGIPEWSLNGATWYGFGLTEERVRQIAMMF